MNSIALVGGTLVFPDRLLELGAVVFRDGKIAYAGPADAWSDEIGCDGTRHNDVQTIDCRGLLVSPGFIDLHVHGGDNADFMDGTTDAVRTAMHAHLRHGTTTIFPTTTTGSPEQIDRMLVACQQVAREVDAPHLAGVHLYGPFFAADKSGCHRAEARRAPLLEEYHAYFESGIIRIATCAAELPGAEDFYRAAADAGCLITCGHSNASWPEMQAAFDCGMRHVDHFWCAMSSVPSLRQRFGVPMQASMAEFVLMNRAMSTEVIADGKHLSPELLEFAYRMLTPERLCLVTDCNRALDQPAGDYAFGDRDDNNMFYSDTSVGWTIDRTSLASSVVGMDTMVRTMLASTSASLQDVIRMASLTPAQRTGIDNVTGSLAIGKRADLLVLNDRLEVQRIFVSGNEAFCFA